MHTASALRFHDNPNSPSADRSLYYQTSNKVRKSVGLHSRGSAAAAAAKGEDERKGAGSGRKKEVANAGSAGMNTSQGAQQGRRGRASRRGGNGRPEASFRIPLGGVSKCCDKPIKKSGQVVREGHVDLIGTCLFDVAAVDERGERLQDLARDSDRADGHGWCCHCTLLHETGECTGCGKRIVARSYVSIPRTRAGTLIREIVNDLAP